MKKCTNCGKRHKDESGLYCNDCGSKLEQEVEMILPKKAVRGLKKNALVYIATLGISVIAISTLTGLTVKANNDIKDQTAVVSSLNLDLQKKDNELSALQDNLSQTEEGRKQLEVAKGQVDAENKQLDTRATSAEQTASKAKSDLAKTQSDLNAKQSELASVNSQLAKAQRGVALFGQTTSLFNKFSQSSSNLLDYFSNGYIAIINKDFATADYYSGLINTEISNNISLYNQINAIFNNIKSGNY